MQPMLTHFKGHIWAFIIHVRAIFYVKAPGVFCNWNWFTSKKEIIDHLIFIIMYLIVGRYRN